MSFIKDTPLCITYFIIYYVDSTGVKKLLTRRELYEIMKDCKGKKFDERKQWELIQSRNRNVYPCDSLIQKAKKECYPDKKSMQVTETTAEIQLQALLDHTTLRLHKYVSEVVEKCL